MNRWQSRVSTPAGGADLRRFVPIIAAGFYLTATAALFAFGPWPWPVEDGTTLYLFLLASHVCLALGYVAASVAPRCIARASPTPTRVIAAGSVLTLLLAWPTVQAWAGGRSFIDAVITAWNEPVTMYRALTEFESSKDSTPWITYARAISAPMALAVLPLLLVYWRSLTRQVRVLGVAASVVQFGTAMTTGRNKGLADTLIVVLSCWAIVSLRRARSKHPWKKVGGVLAIAAMVFAFATFFERGSAGRAGPSADRSRFLFLGMAGNYDHALIRVLPESGQNGALSLMGYLSIGYYGLYLSLQEPFVWCYGLGHSTFLHIVAERVLGLPEIRERSFPYRVQVTQGWDMYGHWHTAYPWLASDIGFPGVVLLMILLGWATAKAWIDAREHHNAAAVVVFTFLAAVLWYLPANNSVLGVPEQMVAFWVWLFVWIRSRRSRSAHYMGELNRARAEYRTEPAQTHERPIHTQSWPPRDVENHQQ